MSLPLGRRTKVVFAVLIAFVGVGVAWRALRRPAPAPTNVVPAPTPPKEMQRASAYEIKPTAETVSDAADRVADVLRAPPASVLGESGVSLIEFDRLADRVSARLSLVLSGATHEEVLEETKKDGALPDQDDRIETIKSDKKYDTVYAPYERWPEEWRFAAISAERAFVRVSDWSMPRDWQQVMLRNGIRLRFPPPPEGAPIIELVMPALVRGTPCDLGFSYFWDSAKQQWIGVSAAVYLAHDDRVIPPP